MALKTPLIPITFLFVLMFALTGTPAGAQSIMLNAEQKTTLKKISAYLNKVTTLKARFVQRTSKGGYGEGDVWVWRPGRFRFEYDPPNPFLLVADTRMIGYYDFELEEASFIPLGSSPASFFLSKNVDFFRKEISIVGYRETADTVQVAVIETGEAEDGQLSLVFTKNPIELLNWTIVDGKGLSTTVTLIRPKYGVKVNKDMFWAKEMRWMVQRIGEKK